MSVNTSEEYLDELLHAIEPIIYPEGVPMSDEEQEYIAVDTPQDEIELSESEAETVISEAPVVEGVSTDFDLSEMPDTSDISIEEGMPLLNDTKEEEAFSLESLVAEMVEENVLEVDEEAEAESDTEVSMDDLLAALTSEETAEVEEMDIDAMLNAAAEAATETQDSTVHEDDVKELLKQFSDDEDLSDIGDILERDDNSEAVDESLLLTPEVEVFQLEEDQEEEKEEPKKRKKGFFSRFKKNKKKKDEEVSEEDVPQVQEITELPDEGVTNQLMPEEMVSLGESELSDTLSDVDSMDISSLLNVDESELLTADEGELDLGNLFTDSDMTDIDQLLAAGSFEELGAEDLLSDTKDSKSAEGKEVKKGFFGKLIDVLFEEDEDESKTTKNGHVPEADATGVTDENLGILDELSKEEKKKLKKEKKEQKKKEKEAKKNGKASPDGENGQGDEEDDEDNKKKKKKKVKKPKPRKVVDIDEKPDKKLSRRKVFIVFIFCFSILAVILLFKNVVLELSNLKAARWAFDNEDYETCYFNLYGEELSEEDEEIFQKSYVILCMQRKLDSYDNFMRMDMEVEALNALFEGVRVYRDMEERASEMGILNRISGTYQAIYVKLGEYGLSNEEIEEILDYDSKVTYTKRLQSIVNGTSFEEETMGDEVTVESEPKPLEDVLPQEEDFLE